MLSGATASQTHFRAPRLASSASNPIDLTSEDDDERGGGLFGPPRPPSLLHHAAPANMASGAMMDPFLNFVPASLGQPRAENASPSPSFSQAPSLMQTYPRSHHSPAFGRSMSGYGPSTHAVVGALPPTTAYRASGTASGSGSQIIDLTSTPSPPVTPRASSVPAAALPPALPADLPPKTPVCIGQLQCNALVVYPINYLQCSAGSEGAGETVDWACVRAHYEHEAPKQQETIHLRSPNWRTPAGEQMQGENFAVMEQRVATVLGPMLGKGLIRLEVRIRRGLPNMPMLPLVFLVFTPKGNIPVVGNFFRENQLMLDHPTSPFDSMKLASCFYHNPHNPPPGGFNRTATGPAGVQGRLGYGTVASTQMARWTAPQISGKSVEVQRSQADELFKNLQSGDELGETDPPPEVKTKLYPHQKKAVTFLLEREREISQPGGQASSLWQMKQNPFSNRMSWQHLVTSKEVHEKPPEAKGAILADDMGLGKTITCVSLIATTLNSAQAFAAEPLPPPIPPPAVANESSLDADHFKNAVWGLPTTSGRVTKSHLTAKEQAKLKRESEAAADVYTRACRLKVKSRATLIVCPLSTISNWEDQFREHWAGQVTVVGGGGGVPPTPSAPAAGTSVTPSPGTPASALCSMGPLTASLLATESRGHALPSMSNLAPPRNDVLPAMPNVSVAHAQAVPTPFLNGQGPRPCRIYVYHGNSRRPDPLFLADFDAVITTFSTLATEFSRQCKSSTCEDDDDSIMEIDEHGNTFGKPKKGVKRKKGITAACDVASPLQSVCWFRVVLDEAHSIKETGTVACRACCDLEADRRLCLTGTPVQNKLDDLFALIKFLRLEPFVDKAVWTEYIGSPVKFGQPIGFARLQAIMKVITLRRTKETRADNGQKILALPPRRDELRYLKFDANEQAIYNRFFEDSKAEFTELSRKNEVMKNYVGILQKILRLRQICDHYELVQESSSGLLAGQTYDDIAQAIAREGLTVERAAAIFAILRESASATCAECGSDLGTTAEALVDSTVDVEGGAPTPKRGRKSKAASSSSRANSPGPIRPILTRCQHLFCPQCYRASVFPGWPHVQPDMRGQCTACPCTLSVSDAIEVAPDPAAADGPAKKKGARKEKRQKGSATIDAFHASTKIRTLMSDLVASSKANPNSVNYDPSSIEIQNVDENGNDVVDPPIKTIVFSQWTTMLDKIEDALELAGIGYERLDGTMRREERIHAMEALKHDATCEVLLVSLKAGGVGLNLVAASRVYLMDPYWNPAVEHQAVDRVHRLGQTRPVITIKLVIENSIEDRLLIVQKRKEALANMTLSHVTKAEVMQRRLDELKQLFDS